MRFSMFYASTIMFWRCVKKELFRHVSIVRLEAGLAPSWGDVGGGFGGRSGAGLEAGWGQNRKQVRG